MEFRSIEITDRSYLIRKVSSSIPRFPGRKVTPLLSGGITCGEITKIQPECVGTPGGFAATKFNSFGRISFPTPSSPPQCNPEARLDIMRYTLGNNCTRDKSYLLLDREEIFALPFNVRRKNSERSYRFIYCPIFEEIWMLRRLVKWISMIHVVFHFIYESWYCYKAKSITRGTVRVNENILILPLFLPPLSITFCSFCKMEQ